MDSAYASTFLTSLEPTQTAELVHERLSTSKGSVEDCAEWFRELQTIEQAYHQALNKLSNKSANTDSAAFGILERSWKQIVQNSQALAQLRSQHTLKLMQEIIGPLAAYDRSPQLGNIGMLDRTLTNIAKEMTNADGKLQKAAASKSKSKTTKLDDAQEELRKARARWDSEAPNVLETLQQVDEARMTFLKDIFLRYDTSIIDLSSQIVRLSEANIAGLLDLSASEEAMDFVTRRLGNAQTPNNALDSRRAAMTRTASAGDSGSVRSSGGGATMSLKSKFGTLLKGRRSGSPTKRQSILPRRSSNVANGVTRQTLPQTQEEPEPEPAIDVNTSAQNISQQVSDSPSDLNQDSIMTGSTAAHEVMQVPAVSAFNASGAFSDLSQVDFATVTSPETTSNAQHSPWNVNILDDKVANVDPAADDAALNHVTSTLRAQPTISRRNRGRRDVRNTMLGTGSNDQSAQAIVRDVLGTPLVEHPREDLVLGNSVGAQSEPENGRTNTAASLFSFDGNESLRSTVSRKDIRAKHAAPTEDGYHCSIIEMTSARATRDGHVQELLVDGEALISLQGAEYQMPINVFFTTSEATRNVSVNGQLLARTAGGSQYTTQVQGLPIVCRYNCLPDIATYTKHMPLEVRQQWTSEEHQTSVKLIYRLSSVSQQVATKFEEVEISVGVDGTATSCVAKPSGTFVRRSNKLIWRLPELTLAPGQEGTLLARFRTTELVKPSETLELKFKSIPSAATSEDNLSCQVARSITNPFASSAEDVPIDITHAKLQTTRLAIETS